MPNTKMTARSIEAIKPPESGQVDYWDADNPGFGLRISAGGRRAWIVMYRRGGVKRRLTLGTYPALSLADARKKAGEAQHAVEYEQADPAAKKKENRHAETVADIIDAYLIYAKREKRSWKKDEQILEKDVRPRFGLYKAKDITRREIIAMLDDILERGAPIQANRTFSVTRRLFNWAMSRDIVEINPCYRVSRPASENTRDRVLSEDEIKAVWKALDAEKPLAAAIYKLRLLTAQRGAEVLAMRWDQISEGWWTIPAEVAKNGIAHRVPLSTQALALIDSLRPIDGDEDSVPSEWLFPGDTKDGHRVAINKLHENIRKRSEVDFVSHDLRRTAASHMTSMGISRLTVAKILNHVERSVTAIYDRHSYDAEKRHALDAWGARLEAIINKTESPGNVVPLPVRA